MSLCVTVCACAVCSAAPPGTREIGGRGAWSDSGPSREIVSFRSCVRAGGRARARSASCYLEGFARWTSSALLFSAARPLCCQNWSVFARVFCKTLLVFYCVENFSHKSSIVSLLSVNPFSFPFSTVLHMFFSHYWRRREPPVSLSCGRFRSSFLQNSIVFLLC